jgi:hypothetical protein
MIRHDIGDWEGICGSDFSYLIPTRDSVVDGVATLETLETIDRCPECDSYKIVFPKSPSRKRRDPGKSYRRGTEPTEEKNKKASCS